MRLGMFMMPVHPPDRLFWSTLEEDTEKSLLADRLGFDELWMGEHFSATTEPIPSPLMFLAGLVPNTRNLSFGTAVINLPNHHPAIVAAEAAQFDHMSKGRFMLGVGPGGLVSDFELFKNLDVHARNRMVAEAMTFISTSGRTIRLMSSKASSGASRSRTRSCPSSASATCRSRTSSPDRRSRFRSPARARPRRRSPPSADGGSSRPTSSRPIRWRRTGRSTARPAPSGASRPAARTGACHATSWWRPPTRRPTTTSSASKARTGISSPISATCCTG